MATNYDTIADDYKHCKQAPWRLHIEHFTLFELLGDIGGQNVLDLACGEGFYTRFIKQAGAARVAGVDISAGMIDLAQREEARKPLGIEYSIRDAKTVDFGPVFDVVTAAFLLNYAASKEELLEMCRAVARNLKPGGQFVTVNSNSELPAEFNEATAKYGIIRVVPAELREGTPYNWRFLGEQPFEITNYYLSRATHEWALSSAGFKDVRWLQPRLSPAGEAECGREYWRAFLEHPPVVFISGCRPANSAAAD